MIEYYMQLAARERQASLLAEADAARMQPKRSTAGAQVYRALLTTLADLTRGAAGVLSEVAENLNRSLGRGCCIDPEF